MCGRFVLISLLSDVERAFDIHEVSCDYRTSRNMLPGQDVPAVVSNGGNRLVCFRWGLIPSWARDPSIGRKLINARAETIAVKPSFRSAFRRRRCLIVANGFYEWRKEGSRKKPIHLFLKSGQPFGFAGLYESWRSPQAERINTCTIVTTGANELVSPIHDRMPVIVPKEKEAVWLDPSCENQSELLSILKPYPSEEMSVEEVSPQFFRQ